MDASLITGGTGFIGQALCQLLLRQEPGHVYVLSRQPDKLDLPSDERLSYVAVLEDIPDNVQIRRVVNLAGESLNQGRWTAARKQRFIDSRVGTTKHLVEWLGTREFPPEVMVSGSAIGWYGHWQTEKLGEYSSYHKGFAHQLCAEWEEAAAPVRDLGTRLVLLRIGIVLAGDGGSLAALLPSFRMGLGGPLGSGQQYWSWIHREDLLRLIVWLLHNDEANGVYNATAPIPVPQREFATALGRALSRPAFVPMPGLMAQMLLGEFASELLLNGQRVLPQRALEEGFSFNYRDLDSALHAIYSG